MAAADDANYPGPPLVGGQRWAYEHSPSYSFVVGLAVNDAKERKGRFLTLTRLHPTLATINDMRTSEDPSSRRVARRRQAVLSADLCPTL